MYGGASDDELADICDDAEFKKKLGVGAEETRDDSIEPLNQSVSSAKPNASLKTFAW